MSNELTNLSVDDLVFGEDAAANLKRAMGWCASVVASGMMPKHIDTAQKALVTLMKGRELGLSPIVALSQVYVVGGKAEISGTIMEALLRKAGISITPVEWTDEVCRLRFKRRGHEDLEIEFTIAEAEAAGLFRNAVWKSYRRDMLYWRALSRGGRRIGADVIHGCYVDGEIRDVIGTVKAAEIVNETPRLPTRNKLADIAARVAPKPEPETVDADTGEIVGQGSLIPDDEDLPKWDGPKDEYDH